MKVALVFAVLASLSASIAGTFQDGAITWTYQESSDRSATIAGAEGDLAGEVRIPAKIGGLDVVAIGIRALADKKMTSVHVPDSVTNIMNEAFYGCTSLKDIRMPARLSNIGLYAFTYNTALKSLVIPEGVTDIAQDLLHGDFSITSVVLSDTVKTMGRSAFYQCSSLTKIVFPEGFREFVYFSEYEMNFQFAYCSGLQQIVFQGHVPANLRTSGLMKYGKIWYPKKYEDEWRWYVSGEKFGGYSESFVDPSLIDPISPDPDDASKPFSAHDTICQYDGLGHTINLESLHMAASSCETPTFSFALTEDGPWQTQPFVFTNTVTTR